MRAKTGIVRRRRHKKVLSQTKGFWMSRNRLYKAAHEALLHAGQYAFHGRKLRKRDLRRLWITRLNAALRQQGINYSSFVKALKDKKIILNRQILSELAVKEPELFQKIVTFTNNGNSKKHKKDLASRDH